jgi:tetratricopeptide (TPR) repeat protein
MIVIWPKGDAMDPNDNFPSEDELWENARSSNPREKAEALYGLAHQAMRREEWETVATLHAAEAEVLLELNDAQYPRALVMQALALDSAGRSDEAIEVIDQALEWGSPFSDETLLAEIIFSKATILEGMDRTEECLRQLDSAINIFRSVKNFERGAYALIDRGDIFSKQSRFAEAQLAFEQAMTFFSHSNESSMFGRARDRLASTLVDQGKNAEALHHLRENVDLYEFLGENERVMFAKYRVGWNLLALNLAHEALPLLCEARAFYNDSKEFRTAAEIDAHIVDALRALGQFTEADDAARRMRAYFESTGNVGRLIVSDINLATGAFSRGDDEAAETLLWSVIERARVCEYPRQERIARLLLAEFFVKNEAFEQATNSLGSTSPEDWGENYAKRAAHLNVIAQVALGNHEQLHAKNLSQKVVEMAYVHDLHEENARAHVTLAAIAELEHDVVDVQAKLALAVALFLAGGCDEEARRISGLLLPGRGISRTDYEDHRDKLPVRADTGPIDTITEGIRPEWMERAGWTERSEGPPDAPGHES